jgi:two-component system cell cycle response regulator DivK
MIGATTAHIGLNAPVAALLVDRDQDTRHMYAEFLSQSFYRIDEAEDGREALAKALGIQHDVIVTETRLPGISGLDLCILLRQDPATKRTPIVVVTGDALAADIERAERAGADVVLVKPCLPETLHGEIQRLVTQSAELRDRCRAVRERMHEQLAKSDVLLERSRTRRKMLNSTLDRHDTTTPPLQPPALHCPACDQPLRYLRSHIGGVSALNAEQWDYFECGLGCGTFQYRERTRKLRRV